ncbi:MAG TPA: hypothetical protein VFO29_03930 [Candidatus Rubrimentiphilum sp.]|nr:hypothetical protein [Candidatus Rubrimentiphilum sp.]
MKYLLSFIAFVIVIITAPTQAVTRIQEFPVPTAGSAPGGITVGPDGALWFTETNADKIGRIAASGKITEFSLLPATPGWIEAHPCSHRQPLRIATGPDRALWFSETVGCNERDSVGSPQIGRMTLGGKVSEFHVPSSAGAVDAIASGPDHAIWFVEAEGGKVGRVSTTGKISEFAASRNGRDLVGIIGGRDDAVWFIVTGCPTCSPRAEASKGYVGRITPEGKITYHTISNNGVGGFAWGPDGALWFTDSAQDRVGRLTLRGKLTQFLFPAPTLCKCNTEAIPTRDPRAIVSGPDSALWIVEPYANKIGRVSMTGKLAEFPVPTIDSFPSDIAAGPDGSIWFIETNGNKIGRLRP